MCLALVRGIVGDDGVQHSLNVPLDQYISTVCVLDCVCTNGICLAMDGNPPSFGVRICQTEGGEVMVEKGRGVAGGKMGLR